MAISVDKSRCTGCSYCVVGCPADAISLEIEARAWPRIDAGACTVCGECITICPNNVFDAPDFQFQPVEIQDRYDAVVIGAGIGGLMTAAGLAKAGQSVLVLEQLSFTGGKYTHLVYKDYAITTAAWTCAGPNSRIGRLCTQLGAPINWVTIHEVGSLGDHWVLTRDGRRFNSLDEAQSTIVGGARGMVAVYRWMADMYEPGVEYPDDMTTREYIERFVPGNDEYIKYVQTIITYCFASQTVDTFSAMETKRAIVDSIGNMENWGTAVGGTKAIIDALEHVIRECGGQIATKTRVDQIELQDGRAVGVHLADGRRVAADTVIHNGGLKRLLTLAGAENLPPDYVGRLRSAVPADVACLVLGTSKNLLADESHSLLHTMGWDPTLNCYAPTYFDPGLAPAGKHILDVFWVMDQPINMQGELDRVRAQLHEVFPNYDDVVELELPMFYTGLWTAELAHRMGQSGADRLDPQSPIENLHLVGYDCIGYGMAGDIIPHGVKRALHTILGDPQYAPRDEKAVARFNAWMRARVLRLMALAQRFKR